MMKEIFEKKKDNKPCEKDFTCNKEDIEEIYLDKFNRINIGLE